MCAARLAVTVTTYLAGTFLDRFYVINNHRFYSPAQLVRGFAALSDLLDKTWSQVASPLPLDTCLHFYRTWGSAFPTFQLFVLVDLYITWHSGISPSATRMTCATSCTCGVIQQHDHDIRKFLRVQLVSV